MITADRQSRYRKRLKEKQAEQQADFREMSSELQNATAKIRKLEYLLNLKEAEDQDSEQLKVDFQKLKAENRELRKA